MILFTIGTSEPFDRLVGVADAVAEAADERVLVQGGRSRCRFRVAEFVPFLALDELAALISSARIVIAHAGAGSVLLSLLNGKMPLVVPRLRRYGEAIDDHQLVFARRLHDLGLVQLIEDPEAIVAHVRESVPPTISLTATSPSLAATLRSDLERSIGRRVTSS